MNRRTALVYICSATISLTAGCLGTNETPSESDLNESGETSSSMALSLESVADDLEGLSFNIDVISDKLSETEVPTLGIAVENTGNERATWTQAQSEFAFPQRYINDGIEIGLKEEVTARLLEEDGCARMEDGVARDDVAVTTRLDPGDSIEQRYAIAGVSNELADPCPSPGTYRVGYVYGDHGKWGFEFELE